MQLFLTCAVLVFAAVLGSGEALTCYQCDYSSLLGDDDCKTLTATDKIDNCNGTVCSKQQTTVGDINAIQRGCADSSKTMGCSTASFAGVKTVLCYCDTDLCNGASVQRVTAVVMSVLVVFSALAASWL